MSTRFSETRDAEAQFDFDLLICAAHFIGDGMALHQFANDFFSILGSEKSQQDLEQQLIDEWQQRWNKPDGVRFPLSCT